MRAVGSLICFLLLGSAAVAQDAAYARAQLIQVCMQASGAGQQRCVCFADTVLSRLAPGEVRLLWHGQDTPHTLQVGLIARQRCGVRFPGDPF
jgi:hypothetical protein